MPTPLKKILQWTCAWGYGFLFTQLILILISTPILIIWGLPISAASIFGNLIFIFFMPPFLFTLSLIFFAELIYQAPPFLYHLVDNFILLWNYCLSYGSNKWFMMFSTPPLLLLLIIPSSTMFIVCYYRPKKQIKLPLALCALLMQYSLITGYHYITSHDRTVVIVPGLTLSTTNKAITLDDSGAFNKHGLSSSFIQYTVIPALIKSCGTNVIDQLTIKPGYGGFRLAQQLCEQATVKQIIIPFFTLSAKKSWSAFFSLKRTAQENNVKIKRIGNEKLMIKI